MGLTKRKDGYYVEFRVLDDGKTLSLSSIGQGGRLKRWKVGSLNKTVAKQQEALLKTDLMKGSVKSDHERLVTFEEWGLIYLELEEVLRLRSLKDRVNVVRLQLVPFFGKKHLTAITPEDVEAYRAQRKKYNGKAPSLQTINNDHIILKHCLNVARRKRLLTTNPASLVPIPNANNERDRVLTAEEWQRLHEVASPHLKPILLMAYHLGQRLGEILNLTWDRVDLHRGIITLRAVDTKTNKPRQVPMTAQVKATLIELSRVRDIGHKHVFVYQRNPMREVKTAFKTACRRAGIENLRFHDLRHCAATNLRRAGVDTTTAMQIIGHKSPLMWKRYNSVAESDLLAAASKLQTYHSNTVITPADSLETAESISA
ncbi:MAG: site-specific integrase [Nitrospira sp.]|nr:site-specific integrase [Nitrospira sp.]